MPEREWTSWMRDFGLAIRRSRELVGISQGELARLCGVSQAAVSRLEAARGMATPLTVVLRILSVLQRPIAALPPDKVPRDLTMLLDLSMAGRRGPSSDFDSGLAQLLERYREMTPAQRARFLQVAVSVADAMSPTEAAPARPGQSPEGQSPEGHAWGMNSACRQQSARKASGE